MRVRAILLAAALALMPLATRSADLVVWWEEGFSPEEDTAVRELVAAFEHKTGKQVELVQPTQDEVAAKALAALEAGNPPDFLFAAPIRYHYPQWAHDDLLVDLSSVLDPWSTQFDQDSLAYSSLLNGATGRRGLYSLPMGRTSNHIHVWNSLLEAAGFTLADIPKEWEPFWSFWCDKVQPAVRKATGRNDLYAVGLTMSVESIDTEVGFGQFVNAYEANYVTRDGRLVIDEPAVRAKLIQALASYADVFRKGCTPPASASWGNRGNNEAFLTQAVVMTVNSTLSVPNALKADRPEDYYKNAVTLGWPANLSGQPLAIYSGFNAGVVFKGGGHLAAAEDFVSFLLGDGWLAHWFDFTGERFFPSMPALFNSPFWHDPGDPHRITAVMQFRSQPRAYWEAYGAISGNWRHDNVYRDHIWPKAAHRTATAGISPEQAVDEAIARIKQILSE